MLLPVAIATTLAFAPPAASPSLSHHRQLAVRTLRPPIHQHARASPPMCEETLDDDKAEERAETIEYFKTLGGFSFGSLGLFVALTQGAGLEDVQAGNLVLVSLCAYGAYLLFFDGGVTQQALENQAIRQLAEEEGEIMSEAPRAEVAVFTATEAASEPTPAVAALESDGYARVDGVLSAAAANELLAHVNAELEAKRLAAQTDLAAGDSFGDVLMRENRYDLYLDLDSPVRRALAEALPSLQPVVAGSLGGDAELFELAALVSDPRAPRQPAHPDTPYRAGDDAAVLTCFIALQDVDAAMGPTSVVPRTNTATAHEAFNTKDDGGRERVALLREYPNHVGTLSVGDANIIDSRTIHCGGGNASPKRRVLFYVSFRRRGKVTPSGSLLYGLRRAGYSLDNMDEWAVAEGAGAVVA